MWLKVYRKDKFFVNKCSLYNYADDNSLSTSDKSLDQAIAALQDDSISLIKWFSTDKMQTNPPNNSNYLKTQKENIFFDLNLIKISSWWWGKTIDFKVSFNTHNTNICKKAVMQLNVLKRISKHLSKLGK